MCNSKVQLLSKTIFILSFYFYSFINPIVRNPRDRYNWLISRIWPDIVSDITNYRFPDYMKSQNLSFSKTAEIPLHTVPSFLFQDPSFSFASKPDNTMICGLDLFPIVRLSRQRLWPVSSTIQTGRIRFVDWY